LAKLDSGLIITTCIGQKGFIKKLLLQMKTTMKRAGEREKNVNFTKNSVTNAAF
jgi:hypothetical protein